MVDWIATNVDRYIALAFTLTGVTGLTVTLFAMRTHNYRVLAEKYESHVRKVALTSNAGFRPKIIVTKDYHFGKKFLFYT